MTQPSDAALKRAREIPYPERIVHIMGHDPLVVCLPGEELFAVIAAAIDEAEQRGRDAEHEWYQRQLQIVLDAEPDSLPGMEEQHKAARTMLTIFRDAAIRNRQP